MAAGRRRDAAGGTARAPRKSGNAPPRHGVWLGLRPRRSDGGPTGLLGPGSSTGAAAAAAAAIIASSVDDGADDAFRRRQGRWQVGVNICDSHSEA